MDDLKKEFTNKFGGYFEPSIDSFRFYSELWSWIESAIKRAKEEAFEEGRNSVTEMGLYAKKQGDINYSTGQDLTKETG